MPSVIDSTLWIDFSRARSPVALKRLIAPYILSPDAALIEPIAFEVLRNASDEEHRLLNSQFQTMPLLETPPDLWTRAAAIGRSCRKKGINAGSLDLLIVALTVFHSAELVTFDHDFRGIANLCNLNLKLLQRP